MNYKLVKNTEWQEVKINGEIKKIPSNWDIEQLKNCVVIEKNTKKSQISTAEIKSVGKLPVISQEVKFISGFTDNITPLSASKNNPTIIFGDHSCTLKLVNFNYVLGGDGTKVFKDKENTKFLYYSIKNLKLTTEGYKRHYPILKDMFVNLPSKDEKNNIASILSKQESIISNIEKLIEKNEIIFNELSEQLLSGEIRLQDDNGKISIYKNPEDNWKVVEFNGEMKKIPSDWKIKITKDFIVENSKSKITVGELKGNIGKYPAYNCSKLLNYKSNIYLVDGKNLFLSTGGQAAIHFFDGKAAYSTDVYSLTTKNVDEKYYYYVLKNKINDIESMFYGAGLKHLNKKEFRNFNVLVPELSRQKLIVSFLSKMENNIEQQKQLLLKEKDKFEWLLNNLLSGNYLIKEIEK